MQQLVGVRLSKAKASNQVEKMDLILNYVDQTKGLHARLHESGAVELIQDLDKQTFYFVANQVIDVLDRVDSDGKAFLQVNFQNSLKVLITDSLIGFKPAEILGLDMNKLPKVVTTPDLVSVTEAIEDALDSENSGYELEVLKKVYCSILQGAEIVGFQLTEQRHWITRISASKVTAAA